MRRTAAYSIQTVEKMEVVKEYIDDLNAVIRVKVTPENYADKFEKKLKEYRKKAHLQGFRSGRAPIGLIKKKYGKAILVDELGRLVTQSLDDFIETNNIDLMGRPLPKKEDAVKGNFEDPSDFEFAYEIGLTPQFEVNLSEQYEFDYFSTEVDEATLNERIADFAMTRGSIVSVEEVQEEDIVIGEFVEREAGVVKEGGVRALSDIIMGKVGDEATKRQLLNAKIGDTVVLNPIHASGENYGLIRTLNEEGKPTDNLSDEFEFTLHDIQRLVPADIDQSLFDSAFGEGEVHSEEEMREAIKEVLHSRIVNRADQVLQQDIIDKLIETIDFSLPEAFLKRLLFELEEAPPNQESIDGYMRELKWELIRQKIGRENNIEVKHEELIAYVEKWIESRTGFHKEDEAISDDETLKIKAHFLLKDEQKARFFQRVVYENKVIGHVKSVVQINEKHISIDAFREKFNVNLFV